MADVYLFRSKKGKTVLSESAHSLEFVTLTHTSDDDKTDLLLGNPHTFGDININKKYCVLLEEAIPLRENMV